MAGTSGRTHEVGADAVILDRAIRRHEARLAIRCRASAIATTPLADALHVIGVAEEVAVQLEDNGRGYAQRGVAVVDGLEYGSIAEHRLVGIRVGPLLAIEQLAQMLFGHLDALEAT